MGLVLPALFYVISEELNLKSAEVPSRSHVNKEPSKIVPNFKPKSTVKKPSQVLLSFKKGKTNEN